MSSPKNVEYDATTTTTHNSDSKKRQKTTTLVVPREEEEEKEEVHDLAPVLRVAVSRQSPFRVAGYGYFDDDLDKKKGLCNRTMMEHLHHPSNREFCLTLKGDVFVRYNAYATAEELKRDVKTKVPGKIDIGPVFSHNRNRLAYSRRTSNRSSGSWCLISI